MLKKKERPVALDSPDLDQTEVIARVEELIRRGVARAPIAPLSDEFFERPLIKAKASVLEALLEERYSEED